MVPIAKNIHISKITASLTWAIRHQAMWPTQTLSYVKLSDDHKGLHFGLHEENSLVGVVSLFIDGKRAQFRKLAVLENYQGKGYGGKLLEHLLEFCSERKITTVWCNARKDKIDFYTKYDFKKTKKEFVKGGRPYCILEKSIL